LGTLNSQMLLSAVLLRHPASHRLEAFAVRCGVSVTGCHTAPDGAMVTAEVFSENAAAVGRTRLNFGGAHTAVDEPPQGAFFGRKTQLATPHRHPGRGGAFAAGRLRYAQHRGTVD
jgi:hypothetical protein